jgi:hypothetical protein
MRLYEIFESSGDFEDNDPLRVATTAVLSQIKSDIEDGSFKGKFTVKALLKKLRDNGVRVDKNQLIDLVNEEPWSNLISNLNDNEVEFKDGDSMEMDSSEDYPPPEDTIDQMAKRASKKSSGL